MIPYFRAIVLALFVCQALPVLAQQSTEASPSSSAPGIQSPQVPSSDKPKPKQDERPSAGEVPVLQTTQAPQDQHAREHGAAGSDRVGADERTHENNETVIANFTIALAIATALLAVATFSLALSTRGLHKETRRLADEAVKQGEKTERQIVIAEQSTAASVTAAQAAVDAIGVERAWMILGDLTLTPAQNINEDGQDRGPGLIGQIAWLNKGRSPALESRVHRYFRVVGLNDEFPIFDLEPDALASGVVGPDRSVGANVFGIHGQDAVDFRARTKKIALYSFVTYKTVGDNVTVRRSEFSGLLEFQGEAVDPAGNMGILARVMLAGGGNTST